MTNLNVTSGQAIVEHVAAEMAERARRAEQRAQIAYVTRRDPGDALDRAARLIHEEHDQFTWNLCQHRHCVALREVADSLGVA